MGDGLGQSTAHELLVELGYLARYAHLAVFAEDFGKLLERLEHSVGRLVEYHRACLFAQRLEHRLPSFLLWQKAFETESVAGQT